MFKQVLAALERSTAEIVYFCEHDVLYSPEHFDFTPPKKDVFYYNENVWKVRAEDGHALYCDNCKQVSGLVAYRELALKHYRERVRIVEEHGYSRNMGFEPGTHGRDHRVDDSTSEGFKSKVPLVDIRHESNLTPNRWNKDQFRNKKYTEGWLEAKEVPGWGIIKV